MTFLLVNSSKETLLNPIKTKEKLSVLFIGKRFVQSCDTRFRREADATSLIPIGFSISTKEATRPGSNVAKTIKASY